MRKSRGTSLVPLIIVTGDNLGKLVASGYDGSNYIQSAYIEFKSSGIIGATRIPSEITFVNISRVVPLFINFNILSDGNSTPISGWRVGIMGTSLSAFKTKLSPLK